MYQPLYATLSDSYGSAGSTHSMRGVITWVRGWFNSELGSVANVSVSIDERLPSNADCYNKKREWEKRLEEYNKTDGNTITKQAEKLYKKVDYWQKRYAEYQAKEEKRKVSLNISLGDIKPERLEVNFCGIRFSAKHLELLKNQAHQDLIGKLIKC